MSGTGIFAREIDRLDAVVQIGVANGRVISLSVPGTPEPNTEPNHDVLDWIESYLAGEQTDVTEIEIGLTVPTDQRRVLETVRQIPYGESIDRRRLVARSPGLDPASESDLDTASTALAENPIPLFVPTHRVRNGSRGTPELLAAALRRVEGL